MNNTHSKTEQTILAAKWHAFKEKLISIFTVQDKPLGRGSVFDVPSLPDSVLKPTEHNKFKSNTGQE